MAALFRIKTFGGLGKSLYLCNMKTEFGKWLMDIAKYMVTALLLSTIFSDMDNQVIVKEKEMNTIIVASSVVLIAIIGTIYFKYQDHKLTKAN